MDFYSLMANQSNVTTVPTYEPPAMEPGCVPEDAYFPCSLNLWGNLVLIVFYGYILAKASKLIADGSELLLDILNPGLIGGFVIPLLGALPDATIIVVSSLSPHMSVVREEIKVGVGTLAGSTIMLLTIAWGSSTLVGRCDLRKGRAVDKTLTQKWNFIKTGVTCERDIKIQARIMLVTSLSYFLIQGVAFAFVGESRLIQIDKQEEFALAGAIISGVFFIAYSVYMVYNTKQQQKFIEAAKKKILHDNVVKVLQDELQKVEDEWEDKQTTYDEDELNEDIERASLINGEELMEGDLTAPNMVSAIGSINRVAVIERDTHVTETVSTVRNVIKTLEDKEEGMDIHDEEDEEEESILTKKQILIRSPAMLIILLLSKTVGAAILAIFSSPMVKSISNLATNINVSPFYISFVVTPFASNASELIAALLFAYKKKKRNISLTFGAVYGAVIMNNTLCLGIFLGLIYFKNILWEFSAEVVSTLAVTFCLGALAAFKVTFKSYWGFLVLLLYPLSIGLVILLRIFAKWS